jgi:hypothetical protein
MDWDAIILEIMQEHGLCLTLQDKLVMEASPALDGLVKESCCDWENLRNV